MCQMCNPRSMWHPSALLGLLVIGLYLGFAVWLGHLAGVW